MLTRDMCSSAFHLTRWITMWKKVYMHTSCLNQFSTICPHHPSLHLKQIFPRLSELIVYGLFKRRGSVNRLHEKVVVILAPQIFDLLVPLLVKVICNYNSLHCNNHLSFAIKQKYLKSN